MLTQFFDILNKSTEVRRLLGSNPLRVYPYGVKLNTIPRKPYVLYGVFNAVPYNYLASRSDMDLSGIQADIFSETSDNAASCFNAIRDAIEHKAYISSFSTADMDIEDGLYHIRMDIDFHDER